MPDQGGFGGFGDGGRVKPPSGSFQTTFGYGNDHFSVGHSGHRFGSTSPIQRDFGLNMPGGRFKPLSGVSSPSGVSLQTRLIDFKILK